MLVMVLALTTSNCCCQHMQLHVRGHDMSWASFKVVEVMAAVSQRLRHVQSSARQIMQTPLKQKNLKYKRSAYIAAKHIFDKNTDVVLLCTRHLQKELLSKDPILIAIAINCLSNIATVDLAENLLPNVVEMTKRCVAEQWLWIEIGPVAPSMCLMRVISANLIPSIETLIAECVSTARIRTSARMPRWCFTSCTCATRRYDPLAMTWLLD